MQIKVITIFIVDYTLNDIILHLTTVLYVIRYKKSPTVK